MKRRGMVKTLTEELPKCPVSGTNKEWCKNLIFFAKISICNKLFILKAPNNCSVFLWSRKNEDSGLIFWGGVQLPHCWVAAALKELFGKSLRRNDQFLDYFCPKLAPVTCSSSPNGTPFNSALLSATAAPGDEGGPAHPDRRVHFRWAHPQARDCCLEDEAVPFLTSHTPKPYAFRTPNPPRERVFFWPNFSANNPKKQTPQNKVVRPH